MTARSLAITVSFLALLATFLSSDGFAAARPQPLQAYDQFLEDDDDEEGSDNEEDEAWDQEAARVGVAQYVPTEKSSLLFRRGRRYDPLPKMDHFACKNDGLCVRPLGEKSVRIGLRAGENEVLVEALYAGDDKKDPADASQWCIRMSDRGFGTVASFDNGQCPAHWSTANDHPHFTPLEKVIADARSSVDLVARRRAAFFELTRLLESSAVTLGKEDATRKAYVFAKVASTKRSLVGLHDATLARLAKEIPVSETVEFKDGQFRQRKWEPQLQHSNGARL